MKKKYFIYILLSFFGGIIFTSCSKHLEKEEALKIVKEKFPPSILTDELQHGEILYCLNFGGTDISFEQSLAQKGLITFTYLGRRGGDMFNPISYSVYNVELTNEGKKYYANNERTDDKGRRFYYMKVAKTKIVDISDLHEIEINGEPGYTATYTWKYCDITPFGEAFNTRNQRLNQTDDFNKNRRIINETNSFSKKVKFYLYNDYWVVKEEY